MKRRSRGTPRGSTADGRTVVAVRRLEDWLFGEVPGDRVRLFTRLMAIVFLAYMERYFRYRLEWLTPAGFHHSPQAQPWYNPAPWPPMPAFLVPAFGIVLFCTPCALILRPFSRPLLLGVLALNLYVELVAADCAFTLNKLFIVSFAVLSVAPRPRPSPDVPAGLLPRWVGLFFATTLVVQYFTAGTCKVFFGDWLTDPDVLWQDVQGLYRTDIASWMLRTLPRPAWTVQMYLSLGFELAAPLLFGVRRLRWIGIVVGTGFHAVIAATMHMLTYFSLQIVAFYVFFLPPRHAARADALVDMAVCTLREAGAVLFSPIRSPDPSRS